jgi:PAT family beta-lactamase induction signal transducer AmpG
MHKRAYYWIPSLYFFQSIPFAIVSLTSLLLYQQIGFSNSQTVLLSSLFMLPWSLKLFIVPFLENKKAPKKLIVRLQLACALLFLILALAIDRAYFAPLSIVVFIMLALVSSTHDIVADALYLTELNENTQKIYVGIRTIFYQIGVLFVKGGLIIALVPLALYYHINSWRVFFLSLFALVFLLTVYHNYQLPHGKISIRPSVAIKDLIHHLYDFSRKHFSALFFIFFYNISTAPMQKILPLFLLDHQGMNLSLSQVGQIYGIWGTGFFMLGAFISGYLISRYSVSQSLKSCALLLVLGHGGLMSIVFSHLSAAVLYPALIGNQFITGLANGAYMGYLLYVSNKSEYPMSAYTLCTSLMALSILFFGALSGILLPFISFTSAFLGIFILSFLLIAITFSQAHYNE